jgi:hypothetical protein
MLCFVTRELHAYTIEKYLNSFREAGMAPPAFIRPLTYETLLALKRAPVGNYVFTDLDRLTSYEIDAVTEVARALRVREPQAAISNFPNRVLGRYTLLRRLYEAKLNSFNIWRLDEARTPDGYPVFIRREQDALGPETPLLHDEGEFRAAVAALQANGKGLTGRVAVQYRQRTDANGVYRKYGAFCFGGRIVPQHLFVSKDWLVKRSTMDLSPEIVAEEESYVFDNPHADHLRKVFALAETDFGRVDYAVVDGRIEVFEINTNPNFPRMKTIDDGRQRRRLHVMQGILEGFRALDGAQTGRGLVRFRTPKPKLHRLRDRSLGRRWKDFAAGCKWRALALMGRL